MKDASHATCPECGTKLEAGFMSYGSGLVWHKTKLHGLKRLFIFAFATGRPVVGNWMSSGLMTSRPAMICDDCGAVILPKIAAGRLD